MSDELYTYERDFLLGMMKRKMKRDIENVRDAEGTPVEDEMRFHVKNSFKYYREIGDKLVSQVSDDDDYIDSNVNGFLEARADLHDEVFGESVTED